MKNNSNGNVLFLILIAVALFAALSYAVTQSSRSGGGDASSEQMSTAFAQIQNAIADHRAAYQRLAMSGYDPYTGIDDYWRGDSNMYADYSYFGANENNSDCSADPSCTLYAPKGGGIAPFDFVEHSAYGHYTNEASRFAIRRTWWSGKGTPAIDTIYRGEVTKVFCNYYNKRLGINADLSLSANQFSISTSFAANGYSSTDTPDDYAFANPTSQGAHLNGKDDGCLKANGVEEYYVTAIIWPR